MGLFSSKTNKNSALHDAVNATKSSFFSKLSKAVLGKSTVDEDFLDDLEEILITSDLGISSLI